MKPRFSEQVEEAPRDVRSAQQHADAWLAYESRTKRPNTLKRFRCVAKAVVEGAGDKDLAKLRSTQYQGFVEAYASRCRYYQHPNAVVKQPRCRQMCDINQCPMRTNADPATCPAYRALKETTVSNFIGELQVFNDYLLSHGYIDNNPVIPVAMRYNDAHARGLSRIRNNPELILFKEEHVRKLISETPLEHQVVYFGSAKYGLRTSEVLNLVVTTEHYSAENETFLLTDDWNRPGLKRIGNRVLPWDDEVKAMLEVWMPYRDAIKTRSSCIDLFLTDRGTGWSPLTYDKVLNKILRKDCERLKLKPANADHYTWKAFRKFFSTHVGNSDTPDRFLRDLRGDVHQGPFKNYWKRDSELHKWYRELGPKLLR